MHNEYINTYLDILNNASKKHTNISKNKKQLIIEEKRKLVKKRLILESAEDIECIVIYPNLDIKKEQIKKNNPELKDIDVRLKTYKIDILQAFKIDKSNILGQLEKGFQYSFNKNEFISSLPKDINFLILNKQTNSVAYKAGNEPFKAIKNFKGSDISNEYDKNKIINSFYKKETIKINRNRKKIKNSGTAEELQALTDFKNNICKIKYNQLFENEISKFNEQYTSTIGKKLDIFNWFHDNFILNSDVYIYKFAKDGSQLLQNTDENKENVLKFEKGKSIKSINDDLLKSIMANSSNEFIYHIESIRDFLNAMILEKLDSKKNMEVYKKFQNTIRKKIVEWIQQMSAKYEKCSLQTLIEGYVKVNPPVTSNEQQIDYNKKAKAILNGFSSYKQKEAKQFKALAKTSPDLYNDILYVLNESDKPGTNTNIKPYKKMFQSDYNISIQEYNELEKLEKEFIQIVSNKQAYAEFKNNPDSIKNISEKEKNAAFERQKNNKEFNKTCRMLGFKDKKSKKGLAALIERILEGILSFFGGGDTDPTQANFSAIVTAMPFIKKSIKAIPPGKYPVYFGNNVSQAQMERKFQELIN